MMLTDIVLMGDDGNSGFYSPTNLEELEREMVINGICKCKLKIYVFGKCLYDGIATLDEIREIT